MGKTTKRDRLRGHLGRLLVDFEVAARAEERESALKEAADKVREWPSDDQLHELADQIEGM